MSLITPDTDLRAFMQERVSEYAAQFTEGSALERQAQAVVDITNRLAANHELEKVQIGAVLSIARDKKLYTHLGYSSFKEMCQAERFGGLGYNQITNYMVLAGAMRPQLPQMAGQPPTLDPASPTLTLTPQFVVEHGAEKSAVVARRWASSSSEERATMVDALGGSTREFIKAVFERDDVSFSLDEEDVVMLWRDSVGSPVMRLLTTDPQDRQTILDALRVNRRPKT